MGASLIRYLLSALLALVLPATASAATPAPPPEIEDIPHLLLVDTQSQRVLYARDAATPFPPASVTKVMTVFVAFERMAAGTMNPAVPYTMSAQAFRDWHRKGSTMFLNQGQTVPTGVLLHGITTVSANDGCIVLAEGAAGSVARWVSWMNDAAARLGMKDTHYNTPNGYPDGNQTLVSARDMVTLGEALIERYPALYAEYFGHPSFTWNNITQPNHDPTLGIVPGADGIKTGFTDAAGYNFLGTAERKGRRLMMMIGGAHNGGQRARAARALLEWGFNAWDNRVLFRKGQAIGTARVQGGDARQVPLVARQDVAITTPHGDPARAPRLWVRYNGPLIAPLAKGAAVGYLEVVAPGQYPVRVPLVTAEAVKSAGVFDRIVNGLTRLFA